MTAYDEAKAQYEAKQKELTDAKKRLDQATKERKNEVVLTILGMMEEFNISIEDLGKKAGKIKATKLRKARADKGGKLPAKYRDTASGKTWSGRGVKPAWYHQAEAVGTLEKLAWVMI